MKLDTARHAFVTGGANGIGLAIAEALAGRGIGVTVADVDREQLEAVTSKGTPNLHVVQLDVRDRTAWAEVRKGAEAKFGPVDLLFNNAGIASGGIEIVDADPEAFDRVVAVDLNGVFNGVQAFGRDMRDRKRGHIINTASMAGICGPRFGVGGSYAAAKYGVVGLSEVLRAEMAPHGVGVSILCPGQVQTAILNNSHKLGGGMPPMPAGIKMGGDPSELVAQVIRGIETDARYILSHPADWWSNVDERHEAVRAAFADYSVDA